VTFRPREVLRDVAADVAGWMTTIASTPLPVPV
jgi:hypothetical protein